MTAAPKPRITAWSYSRYSTYRQCPLKLKLSAIDRIKEPQSPAMARGDGIHKTIEAYLKDPKKRTPKDYEFIGKELRRLKKIVASGAPTTGVEEQWAFRKDWTRTTWDDWTGCWLRAKVDLVHAEDETVVVTDWKSGKFRPDSVADYLEQLELYALVALLVYESRPGLAVRPRLVYTDLGIVYPTPVAGEPGLLFTPDDAPRLKKTWAARARPMLADRTFAPRPNRFCKSCHYRRGNAAAGGGQCPL